MTSSLQRVWCVIFSKTARASQGSTVVCASRQSTHFPVGRTPSSTHLPCTPLAVEPLQRAHTPYFISPVRPDFGILVSLPSRVLSQSVVLLGSLSCATHLYPCSLLTLSQVAVFQHNWVYLPFYILQVRLYSCSFMSVYVAAQPPSVV